MSERLNLVVPEELVRMIEAMRDQSIMHEDLPRMNKSDVARHLLKAGVENSEHVEDVVPEHDLIAYRRDELKRENKLRDWRAGFRTRVKRQFVRRFRNGYTPDELAEFSIGMRDEARILWHDNDNPDHVEARREAIDYVDAVVDQAREDYDVSTHDPLDVESLFSGFSGVEDGEAERERIEIESEYADKIGVIRRAAEDRLSGQFADPDSVATMLAGSHNVPESLTKKIVDDVRNGRETTLEGLIAHV